MGLLDSLARSAKQALKNAAKDAGNKAVKQLSTKTETIKFASIPANLDEMKALPEATLDTPFKTAALTICALCTYAENKDAGREMLNFLKGPQPMSPMEEQFISNRFMDGKKYIPRSFFKGAEPSNDYTPTEYSVAVSTNPYTYKTEGYASLYLTSGGADSPREIKLRKKGEQWFLWEQYVLSDIRKPKSEDPWA